MWIIIGCGVCLVIGFAAGKVQTAYRLERWIDSLPNDYQGFIRGAFHDYPPSGKRPDDFQEPTPFEGSLGL